MRSRTPNRAHLPMEPQFADDLPCGPRRIAVLRLLGYRKGKTPVSVAARHLLDEASRVGPSLAHPRAVWRIVPVGEKLDLEGRPDRVRVLKGATCLAFALCTIGPGVEQEASRLSSSGELALASVFDAWGSEAVETLAENLQRHIKTQVAGFWAAANRLSPGYRGWSVEDQAWLFSHLPAAALGVRLTPGFMMVPRKSISFVMKLSPSEVRQ